MKKISLSALLGIFLIANPSLKAMDITVQNFSFEDQILSPGDYTSNIDNWSIANSGAGVQYFTGTSSFYTTNPLPSPAQGFNSIYIGGGIVYQDVGALAPNTLYTHTVALGNRLDQGANINGGTIKLINGTDNTGSVLATSGNFIPTPGYFQDLQLTFQSDAFATGDLTIGLFQTSGNNDGGNMIFNNVLLDAVAAVPEPAAYCLFGPALLGLVAVRQYKQRLGKLI